MNNKASIVRKQQPYVPIHVMTAHLTSESSLLSALTKKFPMARLEMDFALNFVHHVSNHVQALDLASLIDHNKKQLTHISMHNVNIQGDLAPLVATLSKLNSLKHFSANSCSFDSAAVTMALSELPCLDTLAILDHSRSQQTGNPDSRLMTKLIQRGKLKDLRLTCMTGFGNCVDATVFFEAVMHSPALKRLWCFPDTALTEQYVLLAAQMLENNSTLQELSISVASKALLKPIAQSLTSNTSVTNLNLQTDTKPVAADLVCFLPLLESNCTIQQLTIRKDILWSQGKRKWVPAYQLATVRDIYYKLEFYLSLNNAGRKELVSNREHSATAEDWLSAIAYQENTSIIYYFAIQNPLLILPVALGGLIPPPTKETRARDNAQQAAKNSYLFFQSSSYDHLELRAATHVRDALLISIRPIKVLTLRFASEDQERQQLSTKDLAALIVRLSGTLEQIRLHFVTFEGPTGAILEALQQARALKILSARIVIGVDFDRIIGTLVKMPKCTEIDLVKAPRLSFRALTSLIQRTPIKILCVKEMEPPVRDSEASEVSSFFDIVQKSPSLKVLSCSLSPSGQQFTGSNIESISHMIRHNTSLEELELVMGPNTSLEPIAVSFRGNNTLKELKIFMACETPTSSEKDPLIEGMMSFISVLETSNTSLEQIQITNATHRSFLRPKNFAGDTQRSDVVQKMERLLAQNRKGRILVDQSNSHTNKEAKKFCERNPSVVIKAPHVDSKVLPQGNIWPMPDLSIVKTKKKKLRPFKELFKRKSSKKAIA